MQPVHNLRRFFSAHGKELHFTPLSPYKNSCLTLGRETDCGDFVRSLLFRLLLLFCFHRVRGLFFIHMGKGRTHLLESFERCQHQLLIFKHSNSVIWLDFQVFRLEGRVNCLARSIHNLRVQDVLFNWWTGILVVIRTRVVKLVT